MGKFFYNKKCDCKQIKNENNNYFTLANLQLNETAKILKYNIINFNQKKRLLELGLIKGNIIKLINKSMLGEVMLFEINGYMLGIRKKLANEILCEIVYD